MAEMGRFAAATRTDADIEALSRAAGVTTDVIRQIQRGDGEVFADELDLVADVLGMTSGQLRRETRQERVGT